MRRTRIEEHAPSAKRHGRETNGPAATGGRVDGNEESTGSRPRSGTPEKRSLAGPSRVRRFQTIKLVRRDVGQPSQRRRSVAGLAETSIRGPRSTTRNHRRRRHVWANTYFRVSNTDVNSVLHRSATRENEESEDEKTVALYVEFRSLEAPNVGSALRISAIIGRRIPTIGIWRPGSPYSPWFVRSTRRLSSPTPRSTGR